MPKKKKFRGKTTWSRRNEANNEDGNSFEADNRKTFYYGEIEYEVVDETNSQDEFTDTRDSKDCEKREKPKDKTKEWQNREKTNKTPRHEFTDLRQKLRRSRNRLSSTDLRHTLGKQQQMDDGNVGAKRERSESPTPSTSNKEFKFLKVEVPNSNKDDSCIEPSFTEEGEIKDSSSDDEIVHKKAWKFKSINTVQNKEECGSSDKLPYTIEPGRITERAVEPNRDENSSRKKVEEIQTAQELSRQEKTHIKNKKSQNEDNNLRSRKVQRGDQHSKHSKMTFSRSTEYRQNSAKRSRNHDHERENNFRYRKSTCGSRTWNLRNEKSFSRKRKGTQDSAKCRLEHDHRRTNEEQNSRTGSYSRSRKDTQMSVQQGHGYKRKIKKQRSDTSGHTRSGNLCQESMKDHEDDDNDSQINHFKYVSVMPTQQDFLCRKSRLQPILTKGKYKDITNLLEVNFNLLREDFIQPLRDGFEDYKRRIYSNKKYSLRHVDNVKIYQDVYIIGPKCTFNSIAHTIKFETSRFRNMRWQSSKRLMNGSLLCLSNDNFETKYFAVVISRNPNDLSKGIVDVQFDDKLLHELVNLGGSFTMVESEAYFEAYKHILKGLQNHNEIPFTDYIVSCDTNIKAPKYLFDNQRVSFSIMLNGCNPPEDDVELETEYNEGSYYSNTDDSERYIQRHQRLSTNVHPLVENTWPTKSSLGLDDSQYRAMRFAITKELALIQGPPGTGKTFIGLKIIEFFLQNQELIYSFEGDMRRKPILVVCYTNHALDQFLEGILNLNVVNDIIRVGGGCKNPTISQLAIREKRRNFKKFSAELIRLSKKISQEKDEIRQFLTEFYAETAVFFKGVVHEEVLKGVMGKHYYDIREYCNPREFVNSRTFKDFIQPFCSPHLDHFNLLEWLLKDDHTLRQISQHDSKRKLYDEREKYTSGEEYDAEYFHQRLEIYEDDDDSMQDKIHSQVENNSIALIFPNQNVSIPKWLKKYKDIVLSSDILTKTEFDEIKNVWTLKSEKRWELYNYWVKMFKIKLQEEVKEKEIQYSKICAKHQELLNEKDKVLMENASVVGLTTTGFAKYQNILQDVQSKIIIIEEAAEILEAHILTTLTKECDHLILIGDHKQLRPKTTSYKIGEKLNLKISLFERMILNGLPHVTLQKQHRMRPEISLYMKHIYKTIEDHPVVLESDSVKGVKHNVSFIRHTEVEDGDIDLMTKSNDHEARMVTAMFKYFVQQGYAERRITILTPYMGQVLKLRNYLPRESHPELRIVAIDNFQGEENDIILLSLVRSNNNGRIGFLGDENRICVSLSRAKIGLYVIGNFKMLTAHSGLWKRIIDSAYCNDNYKDGFEVFCQNHPDEGKILRSGKDFEECVPNGGCNKPCQFRFPCGHSCKMKCHPFDREHTGYHCIQVCGQKTCEEGHMCRYPCHINYPCGACPEVLDKEIQGCGHIQKMKCYLEPTRELCEHKCSEILSCGHQCRNRCGDTRAHTKKCLEKVTKTLLCGHSVEGSCYEEVKDMKCVEKCTEILKCGHPCVGTCGECLQGRLHKSCQTLSNRILVCGHKCKTMCCIACPPCGEQCEYVCSHSYCGVACGVPCFPCQEQCKWSCPHIRAGVNYF